VNAFLLLAVPLGVVTLILPVVAPTGTIAVILVLEFTTKLATVVLNLTRVAPVKLVPVITTEVPTGPEVGVNLVIAGVTVKLLVLVVVPPGVVTAMGPVVAPVGTVAVIWVALLTVTVAFMPLNLTTVAAVKLVPVITTEVPTGPLVGLKLIIVGGTATVKLLALVTVLKPLLVNTETVLEKRFVTARSRSPSPSRSPTVTELGTLSTEKFWATAKVPFPLFLSIETMLE